jgi:hypothetical protein
MADRELMWDLARVHLVMVLCGWVVMVQWMGGVCLPPCSSRNVINYLSNTNQNNRKEYVYRVGHDQINR